MPLLNVKWLKVTKTYLNRFMQKFKMSENPIYIWKILFLTPLSFSTFKVEENKMLLEKSLSNSK